jgi:hypothetical protein
MAATDESTIVIAINKDPEAPICQVSDYYLLEPIPNSSSPDRSLEKDFAKNLRKQRLGSLAIRYILSS